MVSKANRKGLEVGGHIATYQSAASLYEVGFNHFFRGKDHPGGGDHIFIQGHASPGIYARAYLEGRLTDRPAGRLPAGGVARTGQRALLLPASAADAGLLGVPDGLHGLSALLNSIYQARFNRYLHNRGIKDTSPTAHLGASSATARWASQSRSGAIGLPAREELDNLTCVINCNLQQLDGPGPRQRQDRPGARVDLPAAPAGT